MPFSGSVNGVQVYSDKEMQSIVNDVVTFADGSHCNVTTRAVFNNGPGYICFDDPPGESGGGTPSKRTHSCFAKSLRLSRLSGVAIMIEPYSGNMIDVTIKGPEGIIKSVECEELPNDRLHIHGSGGSGGGNVSISNVQIGGRRRGRSRVDIGGGVIVEGLDMDSMFG